MAKSIFAYGKSCRNRHLPVRHRTNCQQPGYGRNRMATFLLVYRQIRLPVSPFLFSLSVVDMALLLAPTLPPPLAILVLHGFLMQIWPRACRLHLEQYCNRLPLLALASVL